MQSTGFGESLDGGGRRWYKRKEELRMTFLSDERWSEETGLLMAELVRIGQRQTEMINTEQ